MKQYTLKNGEKLVLRVPKLEDAQALIDLMRTVDSETKFLAREPGEFCVTLDQEEAFIKNVHKNEHGQFLVAEIGGEIIGSCQTSVVRNLRRYQHRAGMALLVKKRHWNKGIGKKMMEACIEWCKESQIEQLELEVIAGNDRAIAMYEQFGFRLCGTKPNALKYADGTYTDEHIMCMEIKNG